MFRFLFSSLFLNNVNEYLCMDWYVLKIQLSLSYSYLIIKQRQQKNSAADTTTNEKSMIVVHKKRQIRHCEISSKCNNISNQSSCLNVCYFRIQNHTPYKQHISFFFELYWKWNGFQICILNLEFYIFLHEIKKLREQQKKRKRNLGFKQYFN